MASELLIRSFNVEVGDCFYVRIPDARALDGGAKDDFHILIDCGTRGPGGLLTDAVDKLAADLPNAATAGKKRLDLLVVTHEHSDHIKGFDPEDFADIEIAHVWITAAMDPDHPQAKSTNNLHALAARAMREIADGPHSLSPELQDLMELYSVKNDEAVAALRDDLSGPNGPQYVSAGMDSGSLALPIQGATLRVLAPEANIDSFYLGDADATLNALAAGATAFEEASEADDVPANISIGDFERLRSRMLSNAFAFAELASRIKNNTSVVLLIEWSGKRLLFVGDAEWEGDFKLGKQNGSWNVMWNERKELLNKPLDFLKVGHHGSTNSTPWSEGHDDDHKEPTDILDAILPLPAQGADPTAVAIVSTKRKNYQSIPEAALLAELGKRVKNTKNYEDALTAAGLDPEDLPHFAEREAEFIGEPQPWRTDLEGLLDEDKFWVDVTIVGDD